MKKIWILVFGAGLLACEDVVTIDVNQTVPTYVVEGLVTDQYKAHFVRVSRSVDFYSTTRAELVSGANVAVQDVTEGRTYTYSESNHPDSAGYYLSDEAFAGQVGHQYSLDVQVSDNQFTAVDKLYPVTAIDSLTYVVNDDELAEPEVPGYYYEMLFYAHEPQETEDFYLFKFYRNDSLLLDGPDDIYFSNDDLLAEEINGIPTAGFYKAGDTGTVEMYSISNAGFIYYNDLINLLQSDGGMFGSPPVNPRTNIEGGAMGFFQVSSVVAETILIEE